MDIDGMCNYKYTDFDGIDDGFMLQNIEMYEIIEEGENMKKYVGDRISKLKYFSHFI